LIVFNNTIHWFNIVICLEFMGTRNGMNTADGSQFYSGRELDVEPNRMGSEIVSYFAVIKVLIQRILVGYYSKDILDWFN